MSVGGGFSRGELGCLEGLQLVSRENLVAPGRASLVLNAGGELVLHDVVGVVLLGC